MHVMIDLETLAASNNAQIIAIGAIKFNGDGIHDEFYQNIKLKSDKLFDIDGQTVLWWMSQSKEAQEVLLKDSLNLKDSLVKFSNWYKLNRYPEIHNSEGKEVWGNGATFDNVILRNAYDKLEVECPWSFRNDRCFRTMMRIAEKDLDSKGIIQRFEYKGTKHNALDDARNQAECLIYTCNILGIGL